MQTPQISKSPNPEVQPDQQRAVRGFAETFGLDFRVMWIALLTDALLFGGAIVSLGTSLVFSVGAAAVLGFFTYKAQMKWKGDDHDNAMMKALVIGLLTAIPLPITPLIALPAGLLGLANNSQEK